MPPPGQHSYKVSKGGTQLSSPLYTLIPLDLRPSPSEPASSISSILTHHILPQLDPNLPTLFLAECLFPYMSPDDSKEIIKWFGETFHSCMGVVYEMVGLDDSFGNVMRRNLAVSRLLLSCLFFNHKPEHRCATFPFPGRYSRLPNRKLGGSHPLSLRVVNSIAQVQKRYGRLERKTSVQKSSSGMSLRRRPAITDRGRCRISKLEILDEIEELRLVLEHYVIAWGTKGETMSSISL